MHRLTLHILFSEANTHMSRNPTGRRRGAQPGNQNRLIHGIYSKQVSMEDSAQLESMPADLTGHELALARVRLKTCLDRQLTTSPEKWLAYERAIAYYLRLITSLIQKNASLKDSGKEAVLTVMDFIREANEEQHVQ